VISVGFADRGGVCGSSSVDLCLSGCFLGGLLRIRTVSEDGSRGISCPTLGVVPRARALCVSKGEVAGNVWK
jgi:hypothetical protein